MSKPVPVPYDPYVTENAMGIDYANWREQVTPDRAFRQVIRERIIAFLQSWQFAAVALVVAFLLLFAATTHRKPQKFEPKTFSTGTSSDAVIYSDTTGQTITHAYSLAISNNGTDTLTVTPAGTVTWTLPTSTATALTTLGTAYPVDARIAAITKNLSDLATIADNVNATTGDARKFIKIVSLGSSK